MYDALLSGAAGATAAEQQMLTTVRAQASNWRLRKRFESAEGADAYRKATAFEALVSFLACACVCQAATAGKYGVR
jgi:23S rRNA maturation mini-RNase III